MYPSEPEPVSVAAAPYKVLKYGAEVPAACKSFLPMTPLFPSITSTHLRKSTSNISTHLHLHVYLYSRSHVCTPMYTNTHTHTHARTHTHTHKHTRAHTRCAATKDGDGTARTRRRSLRNAELDAECCQPGNQTKKKGGGYGLGFKRFKKTKN
jgi:hypothetical protein